MTDCIDGEELVHVPGTTGCYATSSGRIFTRRADNVIHHKRDNGWERFGSQVQRGGKVANIGQFDTYEEAKEASRQYLISRGEHPDFRERKGVRTGKLGHLRTSIDGREVYIHRLVARAFLPNPDDLPVVRHLNDIPADNRVENLAWGTKSDNLRDRWRNVKEKLARLEALEAGRV